MVFRRREASTDDAPRFDAAVRSNHHSLHAYVRIVYPKTHADAVVNATFAQLWQHLDEVPDTAMRTWLRATARHEVLNTTRGEKRWYALGARMARLDHNESVAEPDIDSVGELQVVLAAMAALPEADRELLLMNALEDLTTEDLASILEITTTAARTRLSRARSKLRDAIEVIQDEQQRRRP